MHATRHVITSLKCQYNPATTSLVFFGMRTWACMTHEQIEDGRMSANNTMATTRNGASHHIQ
jgi:hypothetical protein